MGDKVFYAGDMSRQGSNAEYQLVDERIVGNAPSSISNAEIAALPLTAITAYEMLFDRLQVDVTQEANVSKRIIISGENLLDAQPKMDTPPVPRGISSSEKLIFAFGKISKTCFLIMFPR